MSEGFRFSVIIPFLGGARGLEPLKQCVDSCLSQSGNWGPLEIRIVANLPDTGLKKLSSEISELGVKLGFDCVGKLGVNRARNFGAHKARGELLLFLDDDCVLPNQNFLNELHLLFQERPDFFALGGRYLSSRGAGWRVRGYNSMANAWIGSRVKAGERNLPISRSTQLLGGNACYRRELFALGHDFDENIVSGGDEAEFHSRLCRNGFNLGLSERLDVIHLADNSWRTLVLRAWRQGRGRAQSRAPSAAVPQLQMLRGLIAAAKSETSLLPFSLIHFPVLFLSQLINSPKFSRPIKELSHQEKQENLGCQLDSPARSA